MGSSIEAGNKGQPASPRDGSAVELIGLSYSSIRWLADMNKQGNYSYKSVSSVNGDGSKVEWTLAEWANKIEENFEQNFYVIKGLPNERRPDLINKVFISPKYKCTCSKV